MRSGSAGPTGLCAVERSATSGDFSATSGGRRAAFVDRREVCLPKGADADRGRGEAGVEDASVGVWAGAILRDEWRGDHREPGARPGHHEGPGLPCGGGAGRRRHDDNLPDAGVLRLLQAVRAGGQEARHEGVDRGRHRLSQRVRRRLLHQGEARAAHAGAQHRPAAAGEGRRDARCPRRRAAGGGGKGRGSQCQSPAARLRGRHPQAATGR